jgi:hypothetical protein
MLNPVNKRVGFIHLFANNRAVFGVLMAVTVKNAFFLDVIPCSLIESVRNYGGSCH